MSAAEKTAATTRARVEGSPGVEPRLRGLLRLLWPLPVAALLAGYLLRAAWSFPPMSGPTAGFVLILLAVGLMVYVRRMRGRLERFLKGARGEESVARELALLPASFHVLHGIRMPAAVPGGGWADCDHIVVGPRGVAVIETKNWAGPIEVRSGRLLVEGAAPHRPPLAQVKRASSAVRAVLQQADVGGVPVSPILVFASDALPESVIGLDGVVLCRSSSLRRVLSDSADPELPEGCASRAVACIRPWVDRV